MDPQGHHKYNFNFDADVENSDVKTMDVKTMDVSNVNNENKDDCHLDYFNDDHPHSAESGATASG
jgi:hypothetical protein